MIIPYGDANFESVVTKKALLIDKTKYIPLLEKHSKFFLIRPRRFGKSFMLSLLQSYYDIKTKDKFDTLFGGLEIHKSPTELRNTYIILKMDFSGLNADTDEILKREFTNKVISYIDFSLSFYAELFPSNIYSAYHDFLRNREIEPSDALLFLIGAVKKTPYKVYVLIDEYDNFINNLVSLDREGFAKRILSRSGFVRSFYETLKIGSGEGAFDKFFITGVSPLMLDELASGFNIMEDMTQKPAFASMLGFTEEEVQSVLDLIPPDVYSQTDKTNDEVMKDLTHYYNGYRFSPLNPARVFNPDMVLYFIQDFQDRMYPMDLLDLNVKTDYSKLKGLIISLSGRDMLKKIIEELSSAEETGVDLVRRFTFEQRFSENELKSLLYYLGLLTYTDRRSRLKVPNYVIHVLFWEYLRSLLQEESKVDFDFSLLQNTLDDLAFKGSFVSLEILLKDFFENRLSNMDYSRFSEKHVKIMLISYLSMSRMYNIISEREIPKGRRIDLLLESHPTYDEVRYNYVIELKYIKKEMFSEADRIKSEAVEKVKEDRRIYEESFRQRGRTVLSAVILVFSDKRAELIAVRK
ncbi:MAG TPA: AAA family ATPase [Leptospiraceae bacterium]|nr:AAA family ATPase [Leptospiraceae bacterium]HNF13347.1 AAA family ATPase [Leptospiraceae bacterium]HNH07171.1 AAA family ATPase [Leptospiraceae bacterium]HNI96015.1 AAA family ATPase [Leptospiraceae bacterium]HNM04877.1 AAA family ATPase [Leptospiraceae bacterium]